MSDEKVETVGSGVGTSYTFTSEELEGAGKEVDVFVNEQNKAATKADDSGDDKSGEELDDDNKSLSENSKLAKQYGVAEEDINYARKLGWAPKEKFHGDEKDYKGPEEFIKISEESVPVLRERNRKMSSDMAKMQEMFPKLVEMQVREKQDKISALVEENKKLTTELQDAIDMMDAKRASDITAKMNENTIKAHLTKGEADRLSADAASATDVPGRDINKEEAWAKTVWPTISLEQRESYKKAAEFLSLPSNLDMDTSKRIEYMERKVFGALAEKNAPAAAAVSRPGVFTPGGSSSNSSKETGWDALSSDEKRIASSVVEGLPWWDKKDTDPKAKAEFVKWKKSF